MQIDHLTIKVTNEETTAFNVQNRVAQMSEEIGFWKDKAQKFEINRKIAIETMQKQIDSQHREMGRIEEENKRLREGANTFQNQKDFEVKKFRENIVFLKDQNSNLEEQNIIIRNDLKYHKLQIASGHEESETNKNLVKELEVENENLQKIIRDLKSKNIEPGKNTAYSSIKCKQYNFDFNSFK
mmetsp:Transcript_22626/g.20096  ORF Transcript_22626/g.20096 Transcript_22626/m.20096 type:complete len:184 (+) Transcript_22626:805-1356(+)